MAFEVPSFPCSKSVMDDALGFGYNAFGFEGYNDSRIRASNYNAFWAENLHEGNTKSGGGSIGNCPGFLELWRALAGDPVQSKIILDMVQGGIVSGQGNGCLKPNYLQEQANTVSALSGWHETRPPDKCKSGNCLDWGGIEKGDFLSLMGWSDKTDGRLEQLPLLADDFDALELGHVAKQRADGGSNQELSSDDKFFQQSEIGYLNWDSKRRVYSATGTIDATQSGLPHITVFSQSGENRPKSTAGIPHEGFFFVLQYLGLPELLSLEQVCKPLRDAVRNDAFLWQNLRVEYPLNQKLTDDALIRLCTRAQGYVACLSLIDCLKISDGGVDKVLITNPMLTKLHLPGCKKITADGLVRMVKRHTEMGGVGLKQLRIRDLPDVTKEHLQALKPILSPGLQQELKPQFYHNGHCSFTCDDDRPIDVEACPRCGNARLVYDCTRDRCQEKQALKLQQCRGCRSCIVRCDECGTCIEDMEEYEESFGLKVICSKCWVRLSRCSVCSRPGCGGLGEDFIPGPETVYVCADCWKGEAAPTFFVK